MRFISNFIKRTSHILAITLSLAIPALVGCADAARSNRSANSNAHSNRNHHARPLAHQHVPAAAGGANLAG
jgi:hypothetical protein